MAKYRSRCALNAATFPLTVQLTGRTVMQGQYDMAVRQPADFYGTSESRELSDPQVIYMENVMPTVEGLISCGYMSVIPANPATDFDQAITLRDENENTALFVPGAGMNYIYHPEDGTWVSTDPIVGWTGKLVTRAYVNGRTFVCYEGAGIYEYDVTTDTFNHLVVTGLADADIRGIGASNNYLIAFTELEVHWSSLIDPLDFVPSVTTGAGFAIPQDVKARITAVLGISGGFVIYTAKNAIAAVFTNNTRAPFTFKEIANAGGIQTYEQVTSEQTSGAQYAWTTGGFQKITVQSAEPVAGAINDFIAGKMWDEYDHLTGALVLNYGSASEFPVKLAFISSRYVVMSYSVSAEVGAYQWCLVYDTVLKRWGKLRVDHVDVFSYPYPNVTAVGGGIPYEDLSFTTYDDLIQTRYIDLVTGVISDPPSKLTVGFLKANGEVQLLTMDYNKSEDNDAVIIFGKIQLTRAKLLQMQLIDIEGIYHETVAPLSGSPLNFTVAVSRSEDGYNTAARQAATLISQQQKMSRWARRMTGLNVDIAVKGTFALSSMLVEVTAEGDT